MRANLPVTFAGEVRDVGLVYASSDIVVVPSRIESSGLVPLEAAEFGRAVVAAAVGGLPELITPERGVPIQPESAAANLRRCFVRKHRIARRAANSLGDAVGKASAHQRSSAGR